MLDESCCRCAHERRASPLTCLAICFLVLTYNLLGGFLFLALEGATTEETAVAASMPDLGPGPGAALRSRTVDRLWSITEDLNILYKDNWTALAARELLEFQRGLAAAHRADTADARGQQHRWTFSTSFLYALTLITTIGHGNVTPRSAAGKAVAVAYACVGIPIIMVYLATLGEALARRARALYARVRPARARDRAPYADCDKAVGAARTPFQAALNLSSVSRAPHRTCRAHTRVPAALSVALVGAYVALGTVVFHVTERWSLLDGCYFSFASLATIGFGELRPGERGGRAAPAQDVAVCVCCAYILVGVVVVAAGFNLVREDCGGALRAAAARCATGGPARVTHAAPAPAARPGS